MESFHGLQGWLGPVSTGLNAGLTPSVGSVVAGRVRRVLLEAEQEEGELVDSEVPPNYLGRDGQVRDQGAEGRATLRWSEDGAGSANERCHVRGDAWRYYCTACTSL